MSNFVKIGDDFLAEPWNGLMIFLANLNPNVTLNLPADIEGSGLFSDCTQIVDNQPQYKKAGPLLIFLILTNTEITNNTITLVSGQTTGLATLRIYPNFEPFKKWLKLSWTNSGSVSCDIKRVSDGTWIQQIVSNPADLSAKTMGLEFIDLVFTLSGTNPAISNISVQLQGGS